MKYPRPSVKELKDAMANDSFITFIVGRNPLERLVSAYRDKILNAVKRSHHFKLGQVCYILLGRVSSVNVSVV